MSQAEESVSNDYLSIDSDVRNLVDWANPPTVKDLKGDLSEAMPNHNQHINRVNDWITALRGELRIKVIEGRSRVQPKLVRKQNEWRYSALEEPFLSTDDMFIVNPVTYLDVESAKQNMLILNKQFRVDIPKTKFIGKYVRTAVNTGTVITKLSWESEVDEVLDEVPVFTQTPEELYQIKHHSVIGYQLTKQSTAFSDIAEYLLTVNERWDGKGYPLGLKEKNIPLISRIVSVVAYYVSLKKQNKLSEEMILAKLLQYKHTRFDPNIINCFVSVLRNEQQA